MRNERIAELERQLAERDKINSDWISVKDHLPDSDSPVIAVCMDDINEYSHPYCYEDAVHLAFYSSGKWWEELWPEEDWKVKADNIIHDVTHWQPLPAQPGSNE